MAADNKRIATEVLKAVGGKENVSMVTHCMTRLRFNLKDGSQADVAGIKKIKGVLGVAEAGGQFQVIIGQNVPKVYDEVCKMGGFEAQKAVDENLDEGLTAPRQKLTPKRIGSNILNYMAGSMTPLIPVMMAAGMFKTVLVVFGDLLGILPADSNLYVLFNFVYNAGFYYMPIYIGYTAAKKIGATPVLGLFMGGILLAPDFLALASSGEAFTVFGIPCATRNYSSTVLPILLSVFVLYYVEKFFKKYVPDALSTIFVPTLTILVMLPLALCALAPAAYIVGDGLSVLLNLLADTTGFIGIAIIAALWEYLVMSGMHVVMLMPAMSVIMAGGEDPVVFVAAKCATFAAIGMALGTFLRMKDKDTKMESLGFFISGIVGGVTEPVLYGVGFKYKRPFIGMSIGAALGGIYNGVTGVVANLLASSNFLGVLAFSGGSSANFINGTIGCIIALISSAIVVYLTGYSKEEIETGVPREL